MYALFRAVFVGIVFSVLQLGGAVATQADPLIFTSTNSGQSVMAGATIGFGVALAGNVSDGEFEGTSQLAADPVQGIEARAAAGILAAHLADNYLRVGIDVQRFSFQR